MSINFRNISLGASVVLAALGCYVTSAYANPGDIITKREYLKLHNKDKPITQSERSCGLYLEFVDKIYKDKFLQTGTVNKRFKGVREMYSRCTFYDPFSESTLKDMAELREKALGSDPLESAKALRSYKSLVRRHLANLGVMNMAFDIARDNSMFGDPDFFRTIRGFITDSLKGEIRDGTEPSKAIDIITMAEQDYIIARTEGKLVESELIKDGNNTYYYALDFQELDGYEKFSIFLDVSTPMLIMRERQDEAEKQEKLNIK